MAFRVFDQENQVPTGAASRFGSRNGEQKMGLSVITNNMDNLKRVQPSRQGKKAAPAFAVYDENATADFPIKKETTTSIWAPLATQGAKLKEKPVEVEQKIIAQIDQADTKVQRQPLAAIKPKQALEHSACSSSLIDTSLHQSDFVLQAHQFYEEKDVPQNELSPMVVDTSMTEDNKPFASVSDYNQHLDSALPECYMDDIYKYLRDCEERHRPKPHYMRKQADITPGMRAILIDWLVEVAEEYKLHNETLYLAVSFIDRFLSQMSVLRGKLQLVGTAAMFIASKYEEIYPPEVGEFVYITDDTYTKKQVLRMEQLILKVLAFEVAVPTSHYFLQRFIQLSRSSEDSSFGNLSVWAYSARDRAIFAPPAVWSGRCLRRSGSTILRPRNLARSHEPVYWLHFGAARSMHQESPRIVDTGSGKCSTSYSREIQVRQVALRVPDVATPVVDVGFGAVLD